MRYHDMVRVLHTPHSPLPQDAHTLGKLFTRLLSFEAAKRNDNSYRGRDRTITNPKLQLGLDHRVTNL